MTWLSTYQKEWLRFGLVAGLTTAAVVIPKAMAYAAIAGLPLVVGLYTSLVPLVVYAVMGTSRTLSVTSTSTIAILAASALGQVAPGGEKPREAGTKLWLVALNPELLSTLPGKFGSKVAKSFVNFSVCVPLVRIGHCFGFPVYPG